MASDLRARFRLIVFDLDGTLVDSRRDIAESADALLTASGCQPLGEDRIGRMVGDGAATLVARAFAAAGCAAPPDALDRFLDIYNRRYLAHTRPYDGIEPLLDRLSARSTLAVLTNKPLHATRGILDGLALTRFFGAGVLGGDGPLPRKPDPAGLRHLMGNAHASAEETLLVGDSLVDRQTAEAAGVRCCLARYGFGFHTLAATRLSDEDWIIDAPLALTRFL